MTVKNDTNACVTEVEKKRRVHRRTKIVRATDGNDHGTRPRKLVPKQFIEDCLIVLTLAQDNPAGHR
jgi:hypothetical protein